MRNPKKQTIIAAIFAVFIVFLLMAGNVYAHCDTLDGPVVAAARKALTSGDVTPVLKWVADDDEQMIRSAFQKTLEVRQLGTQARDLADMYFFETLVRIHRAGEGAPYTGLKLGPNIDPAVALADKALESGSVDKLVNILADATDKGIRKRFDEALKAKKHADESVTAGRKFVESYVIFTHYVEGLHSMIKGASEHHEHK
ncbi:MAG: DUF6448 family protein [Desulfobacteraceae bacterium]|jgi:hypothetical protein|nr:DUF6448 family protein [Desulfobacteraceae bacterium]MDH3838303.1 DUF6448 family protein [Desulfobacteraceae bacterium]